MESGAIPDDSITASSSRASYEPYRGRLSGVAGAGGWVPRTNTIGEWLQVDLGEMKTVTGTIIQGRSSQDQWVTSYKLQYSEDGVSRTTYASSDGTEKVFPGNTVQDTVVINLLDSPIDAQYVRFLPQSWHGHMSMRVEVLGCSVNDDDSNGISPSAVLRLNFAGKFLADPSTYNNYNTSFNISTFDPLKYPGWNPTGTHDFRLVNCTVTQVCFADGTRSTWDTTVGKPIIGSAGKLVDLDPDDQAQSQIWGLQVGVDGFFKGDFTPRSFNHMHEACEGRECSTVSKMTQFSAVFFSTLQNVEWINGPLSYNSEFLKQVMSLSRMPGFQLHIKLNVYNMVVESESPDFPYGRVTGTIYAKVSENPRPYGPYNRMLWGPPNKGSGHVPFYVEIKERNKVVLDFANFLKFDFKGNVVGQSDEALYLTQYSGPTSRLCELLEDTYNLGEIRLGGNDWFQRTAGIVEVSVNHEAIETIENNHLAVIQQKTQTNCELLVEERQDGLFVQAIDNRVARKEPDQEWQMKFRAFQFGKSAKEVSINPIQISPDPFFQRAITIVSSKPSGDNGISSITFQSTDPGEPRKEQQLDGQVYMYLIRAKKGDDGTEFTVDDLMVSVHLYSGYTIPKNVTWYEYVYPIFQQYANLYPAMKPIINLGSYEDVARKKKLLKHALTLPETDPNHMPVTRDLSPKKRQMILQWLNDLHPSSDLPRVGTTTTSLDELKKTLQIALQLELSTIPPYLSALFSIKDGENKEVAALIKSVVVDEMKHMTLVANLLNAIGGSPNLNTPSIVPSYPAPLPGGANPGLVVKLARCSLNQIRTVFQGIERPNCEMEDSDLVKYLRSHKSVLGAYRNVGPDGARWLVGSHHVDTDEILKHCHEITTRPQTIGGIYIHQILCPMVELQKQALKKRQTLFTGIINRQITSDQWLGTDDSSPFAVKDLDSAVSAIVDIVSEGEGSDPCDPFDENYELSHYFKFAEMVHGWRLGEIGLNDTSSVHQCFPEFSPCDDKVKCEKTFGFVGQMVPFFEDGVWPTISNPRTDSYPQGSQARKYSDNFNMVYTGLLKCLHEAFNGNPDKLKNDCMGMMHSLTAWANKLVQTPMDPNGDPEIGPNAAPTFEFHFT
ncbi:PREDICTED: uncharacterized protein LOC109464484 [Branchiostoma belcheri]|uniref:Uncharacterized protein LOC109464484 n=1 Tax=Branchiostoma belcheri TaxID=7741 RepID=A0A6P4XKG7_BRABE|nr:PREDICTED: uncharacterized protein LOC109464484 [Branchiostoma belcheri]